MALAHVYLQSHRVQYSGIALGAENHNVYSCAKELQESRIRLE